MDVKEEIKNTQVIVLVGGAAKRMGNPNLAKALLKVAGKTLIDWQIEFYAKHEFKDFILLVGYLHEDIEKHVGNGSRYGVNVKYSVDPKLEKVGKGKALKHAIQSGKIDLNKRAIISYPDDIFLEDDLPVSLLKTHLENKKNIIATIVCVSGFECPYGVASSKDGNIVDEFVEKPMLEVPASTGLILVEPEFYKLVKENVKMDLKEVVEFERAVLPELVKARKLSRMLVPANSWIPINTQKELENVDKILQKKSNI